LGRKTAVTPSPGPSLIIVQERTKTSHGPNRRMLSFHPQDSGAWRQSAKVDEEVAQSENDREFHTHPKSS